ncbi:DUF3105 domain-containing protein [Nocardioides terrisoli]|uniref:DUF3105 domain-containing protein n=1 Tax=Nocardioides terrisoli TaxID=3388267 RepID=UPI00287BA4DD|nr:DUF3105 domain-containing protein [Nocardioides marmorisolisilvae]
MATSKSDKSKQRRERVEELRREQKAKERRRAVLGTIGLVVILVALVVGVYLGTRGSHHKQVTGQQIVPTTPTGQVTVQKKPATVPNTTGIPGVVAYDTSGYPAPGTPDAGTLAHDHVTGPVKYAVIPPVGGPHNGVWMNSGVYDKPIPNERAVHNLEHGAIWITYRPDLPAKEVQQLVDFVSKQSMIDEGNNSNRYMDLSPWADDSLPSPIVLSSWGYQLKVTSPTDPRMQKFVDTFRHSQKYTPEYGAAVDGIPVQTGGRPVTDGSKFANPSGSVNGQGM